MTFRLGCAIWAYKGWVGELFPSGSRPTDFLRLYGQRFTAVEGNTTFYSIPTAETLKRWAAETPTEFKFCPKLPRALTHQGQLTPAIPETLSFLAHIQTLGDRLGVVFAQLPPSYGPDQFEDLAAFLQVIPPDLALALEVRHLDWFSPAQADRLNALLTQYGVGRVLLDTRPVYNCLDDCLDNCPADPQIDSERRKPKLPLQPVITAPFTLVRYISHPDLQSNQPYLQNWATQVQAWLHQNQQIYFFVHCPIERYSPATARHFQHLLEQVAEQDLFKQAIPPLPWDRLEADAPTMTQLNLF
jgi:uncharacterized protein YecE (DUF72 family)